MFNHNLVASLGSCSGLAQMTQYLMFYFIKLGLTKKQ